MIEVTKQQQWDFLKDKTGVTYEAHGEYPYTGLWKRGRTVIAKSVPFGKHIGISSDREKYKHYINPQ